MIIYNINIRPSEIYANVTCMDMGGEGGGYTGY